MPHCEGSGVRFFIQTDTWFATLRLGLAGALLHRTQVALRGARRVGLHAVGGVQIVSTVNDPNSALKGKLVAKACLPLPRCNKPGQLMAHEHGSHHGADEEKEETSGRLQHPLATCVDPCRGVGAGRAAAQMPGAAHAAQILQQSKWAPMLSGTRQAVCMHACIWAWRWPCWAGKPPPPPPYNAQQVMASWWQGAGGSWQIPRSPAW